MNKHIFESVDSHKTNIVSATVMRALSMFAPRLCNRALPTEHHVGVCACLQEIESIIEQIEQTERAPTTEQVENGLANADTRIQLGWIKRVDWTPTPEQVERGLTDENTDVRAACAQRGRIVRTLSRHQNKWRGVLLTCTLKLDAHGRVARITRPLLYR